MKKYRMIVSPGASEGYFVKLVSIQGVIWRTIFSGESPEVPKIEWLIKCYEEEFRISPGF
jgi:hypothetical protein